MVRSMIYKEKIASFAICELEGIEYKCSILNVETPKINDIVTICHKIPGGYPFEECVMNVKKTEMSKFHCQYNNTFDGAIVREIIYQPGKALANWVKFPTSLAIKEPTAWEEAKDWWVIVPTLATFSKIWKRVGENTVLNAITLEQFSSLNTGNRIMSENYKVYKTRKEVIDAMYN